MNEIIAKVLDIKSTSEGPEGARTRVRLDITIRTTDVYTRKENEIFDLQAAALSEAQAAAVEAKTEAPKTFEDLKLEIASSIPIDHTFSNYLNNDELERWNAGGDKKSDLIWSKVDASAEHYLNEKSIQERVAAPKVTESIEVPDLAETEGYREKVKARRAELETIIKDAQEELASLPVIA